MASIRIINFENEERERRLVPVFPNIMRCGILGPSRCGKTNVLMTVLLFHEPLASIYLCSRTALQNKYLKLENLVHNYNTGKNVKPLQFVKLTPDILIQPEQVEIGSKVIFDDILTEGQDKIANFFLRGRHRKISCFYLSQSYTKIPKKSGIRENFNFLIIFRQDTVNLRQLYNEYITGVTFAQFKILCEQCWSAPYGFLTVDIEKGVFLKNFEREIRKF